MKRAKRQTVARGLSGKVRRRIAKILRRVALWGCWYSDRNGARYLCAERDGRRIAKAGLAIAAWCKWRPWARRPSGEIGVFSRAYVEGSYPRSTWMPRGRRA